MIYKEGDYVVCIEDDPIDVGSPVGIVLRVSTIDNPVQDRIPVGAVYPGSKYTSWFAEGELRPATEVEILTSKLFGF